MPVFVHCHNESPLRAGRGFVILLWSWLIVGIVAALLVPAARGYSHAFGYVAYWLVVAPSLLLATLQAPHWHARLRRAGTSARLAGQPAWVTDKRHLRNRRSPRAIAPRHATVLVRVCGDRR